MAAPGRARPPYHRARERAALEALQARNPPAGRHHPKQGVQLQASAQSPQVHPERAPRAL
jgi:hypothetical protein